jgi:CheY-like chemotaxis protein
LAREGYQVELAANGQEALGACQRREYTRILCDVWMPTLDGEHEVILTHLLSGVDSV